jgi:bifunctional DNA-binding transcriptional regulator/antitoxin component of YhaV-PrlF toxin-antitoxin module
MSPALHTFRIHRLKVALQGILIFTLYTGLMTDAGDVRVSRRGQMSLPAVARHRWGLDDGGEVTYLDVGDAVILVPGGVAGLRSRVLEAVTDEDWSLAQDGFGDDDLANE